jgi:hypothetical protein
MNFETCNKLMQTTIRSTIYNKNFEATTRLPQTTISTSHNINFETNTML